MFHIVLNETAVMYKKQNTANQPATSAVLQDFPSGLTFLRHLLLMDESPFLRLKNLSGRVDIFVIGQH